MAGERKAFPKYVIVYNEILELIQQGLYPEESRLPSEEELSLQMDVSRMTLRKALNLLKEDGIIESRHGLGNYVRAEAVKAETGIEKCGNPVRKICRCPLEHTVFSMELRPANQYIQHIFKRKGSVSLEARRRYLSKGTMAAYSYSAVLVDMLDEYGLDLNQPKEVERFLETDIYESSHRVRLEMQVTAEGQSIEEEEFYCPGRSYFRIFEEIYNQKGEMLVFTKHFVPCEDVNILLNWYQQHASY